MVFCVFPGSGSINRLYGIPLLDYTATCLDIYSRAGLQHETQTRAYLLISIFTKTSPYLRPHPGYATQHSQHAQSFTERRGRFELWVKAGANGRQYAGVCVSLATCLELCTVQIRDGDVNVWWLLIRIISAAGLACVWLWVRRKALNPLSKVLLSCNFFFFFLLTLLLNCFFIKWKKSEQKKERRT